MKKIITVVIAALLMIGCDKDAPEHFVAEFSSNQVIVYGIENSEFTLMTEDLNGNVVYVQIGVDTPSTNLLSIDTTMVDPWINSDYLSKTYNTIEVYKIIGGDTLRIPDYYLTDINTYTLDSRLRTDKYYEFNDTGYTFMQHAYIAEISDDMFE